MKKTIIVFALCVFLLPNVSVMLAAEAGSQEAAVTESQQTTVTTGQKAAVTEEKQAPSPEEQKPAASAGQKAKLNSLFKAVQEKSKSIKPAKYEVTLPVSTAGARGAEVRQSDRFTVIWPDTKISPITALTENMRCAADQGASRAQLKAQLDDFKKAFPELSDHELLQELADIVKKVI